jgi:predicted esterase
MRRLVLAVSFVIAGCSAETAERTTTKTPADDELASAPLPASGEEVAPAEQRPEPTSVDDADPTGGAGSMSAPETQPDPVAPTVPDPGPKPTATCSIAKDAEGFFVRNSGKGDYVAYVPASYTGSAPMRAIVGMHGCGDTMTNFARWGVNPSATRATQEHIGISLGSETGNNKCWSMGNDDAKVLAAVADLSKCFWIHRAKVTVAGFSSGGQLAYRVGMKNADKLAGILIENSSLYAADANPDALLTNAARKIAIAHRAHSGDTVFPIAKVKADWTKTTNAGFPLSTSEVAGGHDGTSADWSGYLIPASAAWSLP